MQLFAISNKEDDSKVDIDKMVFVARLGRAASEIVVRTDASKDSFMRMVSQVARKFIATSDSEDEWED